MLVTALLQSPVFRLSRWLAATLFCGSLFGGAAAVQVQVNHPTMDQRIGYPAIIEPVGEFPSLVVRSDTGGTLEGTLFCSETNTPLQTLAPRPLVPDVPEPVTLAGDLPPEGVYRLDLRIRKGDAVTFLDMPHAG